MLQTQRNVFHVSADFQPLMRQIGLDAEAIFTHPDIKVWRTLADRENCTLDATLDGQPLRLHIKRYTHREPAHAEVAGHRLLTDANIPTATLVGWGHLTDARSFVIFQDLSAHRAADKLLEDKQITFDTLLHPTADLAARFHRANLHHRDLYLNHFFLDPAADALDVRLIDPARVARLANPLTRRRWIIKDLSQFWYSTLRQNVTDAQRNAWLTRYVDQSGIASVDALRRPIERKVALISKHDARLNARQPTRNVALPGS